MTPLRQRMIEDMQLAGLAPQTQRRYVSAVRQLAAYYRRSPDQLSEAELVSTSSISRLRSELPTVPAPSPSVPSSFSMSRP